MRILMLHNHYQHRGGEDEIFAAEAGLLEAHGHVVDRFVLHNDSVPSLGLARVAAKTIWNQDAYRELRRRIRENRPDVMHAHNLFPLISPAAYYAARAEGVPVVQSIHNFRWFCANALFFRDGRPCEDCARRVLPWPGILRRCYRDSSLLSAGVASMIGMHRLLGTLRRQVDVIVATADFVKDKLIDGGIPASMIAVKRNFVAVDPGPGDGSREGYALFVGRLTPEKGLATLLAAWEHVPGPLRLRIVGDGPSAPEVARRAATDPRIELLGRQPLPEVLRHMRQAATVIVPSEWYENCPRVVIEALATGAPVLGSRLGAMAELIKDGRTGRLFTPGDHEDLARCLTEMLQDAAAYAAMRSAARAEFEVEYTATVNYQQIMRIYACAGAAGVQDLLPQEAHA